MGVVGESATGLSCRCRKFLPKGLSWICFCSDRLKQLERGMQSVIFLAKIPLEDCRRAQQSLFPQHLKRSVLFLFSFFPFVAFCAPLKTNSFHENASFVPLMQLTRGTQPSFCPQSFSYSCARIILALKLDFNQRNLPVWDFNPKSLLEEFTTVRKATHDGILCNLIWRVILM